MGLLDFFKRPAKASPKASTGGQSFDVSSVTDSHELAEFLRTGTTTAAGEQVGVRESMSVAAVYRCINLLSGVIGGMPIEFKDENTLEVAEQHHLRRLINRKPNGWQTGHEFKKLLQYCVLMKGNGYARKVRTGGKVTALLPMLPHQVKVEQKASGRIEYTYTRKNGRPLVLQQDEVLHVRGMSLDGVIGLGVLQYARETIGTSRAAEKHGGALMRNGARLAGALSHPGQLSEEAYNRLQASMADFKKDGDRFGGDIILEEGLSYNPFGMTSADAEFIENRKFSVQEICMFFGVPPHMVGFTEKATSWGSGIEQQSIGFVNYTLNDWFEAWEGAIERDLLEAEPNTIAEFNTYALLRGDLKGRWEAARIGLEMGALNTDEVRRMEGKPAKPNGEGQIFYSPPNVPQEGSTNEPD